MTCRRGSFWLIKNYYIINNQNTSLSTTGHLCIPDNRLHMDLVWWDVQQNLQLWYHAPHGFIRPVTCETLPLAWSDSRDSLRSAAQLNPITCHWGGRAGPSWWWLETSVIMTTDYTVIGTASCMSPIQVNRRLNIHEYLPDIRCAYAEECRSPHCRGGYVMNSDAPVTFVVKN